MVFEFRLHTAAAAALLARTWDRSGSRKLPYNLACAHSWKTQFAAPGMAWSDLG